MKKNRKETFRQNWNMYKRKPGSLIMLILILLSVAVTIGVLLLLIGYILINGIPNIKPELFAWEFSTDNMSMMPAIVSTVYMTALSLLMAVPIGIFSAIHLTEYAKKSSKLVKVIRTTTETLSGIPSIVYGLFGYLMFVITLGWSYSLIAGAVTLSIMILPLIIRTTEEALMSVPDSYREGSFGLGAGKLYTVFRLILPCAVPGILAGVILAIGRIVGESAALIFTAGTVAQVPGSIFDSARTLSVHMYALLSEGLYTEEAYATAVVLLVLVIGINALSSFIAKKLATR
ncbi:MAG TPA: phosphate ABC transporter permease PstA [Candidatus Copromorpha excrementigallinarum]|uniref:Phosphate transport system permease protein PstA n=1 Tax=Candidatus Allocopromorpha excrementigallinarum TaxID=2840742 RepID=A0A9D1I0X3_9FIRM|nr:phosphate ABC transporter permease PstA [Candidatus Copromorpha excrementigallinarum]